jgi:hypothetical protein
MHENADDRRMASDGRDGFMRILDKQDYQAFETEADAFLCTPITAEMASRASSAPRAAASCIPPGWQGMVTAGTPARLNGVV